MMRRFHIHPEHPQMRLLTQVAEILNKNGLMVYPTDATYALGCTIDSLEAQNRLRMIRRLDKDHRLTLICKDLSDVAQYAEVDNAAFRLLKKYTPGPFTFILPGSKSLPKRLSDPKRKTIGLRIPANPVLQGLLSLLDVPLLSTTAQLPDNDLPLADPDEIEMAFEKLVDVFIDAGAGGFEPTTVIDLTHDKPVVIRQGIGEIEVT